MAPNTHITNINNNQNTISTYKHTNHRDAAAVIVASNQGHLKQQLKPMPGMLTNQGEPMGYRMALVKNSSTMITGKNEYLNNIGIGSKQGKHIIINKAFLKHIDNEKRKQHVSNKVRQEWNRANKQQEFKNKSLHFSLTFRQKPKCETRIAKEVIELDPAGYPTAVVKRALLIALHPDKFTFYDINEFYISIKELVETQQAAKALRLCVNLLKLVPYTNQLKVMDAKLSSYYGGITNINSINKQSVKKKEPITDTKIKDTKISNDNLQTKQVTGYGKNYNRNTKKRKNKTDKKQIIAEISKQAPPINEEANETKIIETCPQHKIYDDDCAYCYAEQRKKNIARRLEEEELRVKARNCNGENGGVPIQPVTELDYKYHNMNSPTNGKTKVGNSTFKIDRQPYVDPKLLNEALFELLPNYSDYDTKYDIEHRKYHIYDTENNQSCISIMAEKLGLNYSGERLIKLQREMHTENITELIVNIEYHGKGKNKKNHLSFESTKKSKLYLLEYKPVCNGNCKTHLPGKEHATMTNILTNENGYSRLRTRQTYNKFMYRKSRMWRLHKKWATEYAEYRAEHGLDDDNDSVISDDSYTNEKTGETNQNKVYEITDINYHLIEGWTNIFVNSDRSDETQTTHNTNVVTQIATEKNKTQGHKNKNLSELKNTIDKNLNNNEEIQKLNWQGILNDSLLSYTTDYYEKILNNEGAIIDKPNNNLINDDNIKKHYEQMAKEMYYNPDVNIATKIEALLGKCAEPPKINETFEGSFCYDERLLNMTNCPLNIADDRGTCLKIWAYLERNGECTWASNEKGMYTGTKRISNGQLYKFFGSYLRRTLGNIQQTQCFQTLNCGDGSYVLNSIPIQLGSDGKFIPTTINNLTRTRFVWWVDCNTCKRKNGFMPNWPKHATPQFLEHLRCGNCITPLYYNNFENTKREPIELKQRKLQGLLRRLGITQNLFEHIEVYKSAKWSSNVELHDHAVVARFLSQINIQPFKVDGRLTDGQLSYINAAFPDLEIIGNTISGSHSSGLYDAISDCLLTTGMRLFNNNSINYTANKHNIIEFEKELNIVEDLDNTDNGLIDCKDSYGQNKLIELMHIGVKTIAFVTPYQNEFEKATFGPLTNEVGEWQIRDDCLVILRHDENIANILDYDLTIKIAKSDIITCNNAYLVRDINTIGGLKLRVATKVPNIEFIKNLVKHNDAKTMEFTLPLLEGRSIMSLMGGTGIKLETFTVHKKLLRTLLTRNLHKGEISYQEMIVAAIGFAFRKYNLQSRTIGNFDITLEEVVSHAFLATVLIRRAYVRRQWLLDIVNTEYDWITVLKQIGLTLANALLTTLSESQGYTATENIKHIANSINSIGVTTLSDSLGKTNFDELENWLDNDEYNTYEISNINEVKNTLKHACDHHSVNCNHIGHKKCTCCNKPTENELCTCCDYITPCVHKCKHKHILDHICVSKCQHKQLTCSCCQVKSCYDPCHNCIPLVGYHKDIYDDLLEAPFAVESKQKEPWKVNRDRKPNEKIDTNRTPGTIYYHSGYKRLVVQPGSDAIIMDDGVTHKHTCAICGNDYIHKHKTDKTPHVKHPQFVGDCPVCWPVGLADPYNTTDPNDARVQPQVDKSTEAIDEKALTLELYTALLPSHGKEFLDMLLTGKINQKFYDNSNASGYNVKIPFLPEGTHMWHKDCMELDRRIQMNTEGITCGKDALKKFYEHTISTTAFNTAVGNGENMTEKDFARIAKELNLNLVLLTDPTITIFKYQPNDNFNCIMHSSFNNSINQHWEPVIVKIVKLGPTIITKNEIVNMNSIRRLIKMHTKNQTNEWTWSMSDLTKLQIEWDLYTTYTNANPGGTQIEDTKIIENGEDMYLTNNAAGQHDLVKGQINIKVPTWAKSTIFAGYQTNALTTPQLTAIFNTTHTGIDNLENEQLGLLVNHIKTYYKCTHMNELSGTTLSLKPIHVTVKSDQTRQGARIKLPTTKIWKALDIIYVKTSGGKYNMVHVKPITMDQVSYTLVNMQLGRTVDICYNNESASSAIRGIYACLTYNTNKTQLKLALSSSKGFIGPAGAGKTTRIVAAMHNTSAVIAVTSGAQRVLKQRLADQNKDPNKVFSYEGIASGTQHIPKEITELFIDEATMLRPIAISHIISTERRYEHITFFGDTSQIGVVDFSDQGGERSIASILHSLSKENLEITNKQYRIAEPLCSIINATREGGYEYIGPKDRKTEYVVETFSTFDMDAIINLVKQHGVQLILDPHNARINAYRQNLTGTTVQEVNTTHRYQGNEKEVVLVIQEQIGNTIGIEQNARYCHSAMTRVKDKLIWVSIGCFAPHITLDKRIGVVKVGQGVGKILTRLGFNQNSYWDDILLNLSKLDTKFTSDYEERDLMSSNENNRFSIAALKATAIKYEEQYGATLTAIHNDEYSEINIYYGGFTIAKFNIDDNLTVTCTYDKFNAVTKEQISELKNNLKVDTKIKPTTKYSNMVNGDTTIIRRINILALITTMFEANGLKYRILDDEQTYIITTSTDDDELSGLQVHKNKQIILEISSDPINTNCRLFHWSNQDGERFARKLGLISGEDDQYIPHSLKPLLNDNRNNNIHTNLQINRAISRASVFAKSVFNKIMPNKWGYKNINNNQSAQYLNEMQATLDLTTNIKILPNKELIKGIDITSYPIKGQNENKYNYLCHMKPNRDVILLNTIDPWAETSPECVNIIEFTDNILDNLLNNYIGRTLNKFSKQFRINTNLKGIDGLIISIEEHIAANDRVGQLIGQEEGRLGSIRLSMLDEPINLPQNIDDETLSTIQTAMPSLAANKLIPAMPMHDNNHLCDQVILLGLWSYVGREPMTIYNTMPSIILMNKMFNCIATDSPYNCTNSGFRQTHWPWSTMLLKQLSTIHVPDGENKRALNNATLVQYASANVLNKRGPWITDAKMLSENKIIWISPLYLPENFKDIVTLINTGKAIYTYFPGHELLKHDGNYDIIQNQALKLTIKLPNWFTKLIIDAEPIKISENCFLIAKCMWTTAGTMTTRLLTKFIQPGKTLVLSPPLVNPQARMVKITLPVFNPDIISNLTHNNNLLTTRTVEVPDRLLRQLRLTHAREGKTFTDLCATARVMLNGEQFTEFNIRNTYKTSPSVALDTAYAVVIYDGKLISGLKSAMQEWYQRQEPYNPSTDHIASIAVGAAGRLMELSGLNSTPKEVLRLIQNLSYGKSDNILARILDEWDKLDVSMTHTARTLNIYTSEGVKLSQYTHQEVTKARTITNKLRPYIYSNLKYLTVLVRVNGPTDMFMEPISTPDNNPKAINLPTTPVFNATIEQLLKALQSKSFDITKDEEAYKTGLLSDTRINELKRKLNELTSGPKMPTPTHSRPTTPDPDKPNTKLDWDKIKLWLQGVNNYIQTLENKSQTERLCQEYIRLAQTIEQFNEMDNIIYNNLYELSKETLFLYDNANWSTMRDNIGSLLSNHGIQLPSLTVSNLKGTRILITALGSKGDLRPISAMLNILNAWEANTYILCPREWRQHIAGTCKGTVILTGEWNLDEKLATAFSFKELNLEVLMKQLEQGLGHNCIKHNHHAILPTIDIFIGMGVAPQAKLYAHRYRVPYIEFNPLPFNVGGDNERPIQTAIRNFTSNQIMLLNENLLTEEYTKLGGGELDMRRLLTWENPTIHAYDSNLIKDLPRNKFGYNVGYMAGKLVDEPTQLSLRMKNKDILFTQGSMNHNKVGNMVDSLLNAIMQPVGTQYGNLYIQCGNKLDDIKSIVMKYGTAIAVNTYAAAGRTIYLIGNINYAKSLKKGMVVIHHCGSGTTTEMLKAGVVHIVAPVAFDQNMWATEIVNNGVGTWLNDYSSAAFQSALASAIGLKGAAANTADLPVSKPVEGFTRAFNKIMNDVYNLPITAPDIQEYMIFDLSIGKTTIDFTTLTSRILGIEFIAAESDELNNVPAGELWMDNLPDSTTAYDPPVNGPCVFESIQWATNCDPNDLDTIGKYLKFDKPRENGVAPDEIHLVTCCLGINLILRTGSRAELYHYFPGKQTIFLKASIGHCVVAHHEVINWDAGIKPVIPQSQSAMNPFNITGSHLINNKVWSILNKNIGLDNIGCSHLHGTPENNLNHLRVLLDNVAPDTNELDKPKWQQKLRDMLGRDSNVRLKDLTGPSNMHVLADVTMTDNLITTGTIIRDNAYGWLCDNNGQVIRCTTQKIHNITYIIPPASFSSRNIPMLFIDSGINILSNATARTTITDIDPDKVCAINRETVILAQQYAGASLRIFNDANPAEYLLICEYDNMAHHAYNHRDTIRLYENTKVLYLNNEHKLMPNVGLTMRLQEQNFVRAGVHDTRECTFIYTDKPEKLLSYVKRIHPQTCIHSKSLRIDRVDYRDIDSEQLIQWHTTNTDEFGRVVYNTTNLQPLPDQFDSTLGELKIELDMLNVNINANLLNKLTKDKDNKQRFILRKCGNIKHLQMWHKEPKYEGGLIIFDYNFETYILHLNNNSVVINMENYKTWAQEIQNCNFINLTWGDDQPLPSNSTYWVTNNVEKATIGDDKNYKRIYIDFKSIGKTYEECIVDLFFDNEAAVGLILADDSQPIEIGDLEINGHLMAKRCTLIYENYGVKMTGKYVDVIEVKASSYTRKYTYERYGPSEIPEWLVDRYEALQNLNGMDYANYLLQIDEEYKPEYKKIGEEEAIGLGINYDGNYEYYTRPIEGEIILDNIATQNPNFLLGKGIRWHQVYRCVGTYSQKPSTIAKDIIKHAKIIDGNIVPHYNLIVASDFDTVTVENCIILDGGFDKDDLFLLCLWMTGKNIKISNITEQLTGFNLIYNTSDVTEFAINDFNTRGLDDSWDKPTAYKLAEFNAVADLIRFSQVEQDNDERIKHIYYPYAMLSNYWKVDDNDIGKLKWLDDQNEHSGLHNITEAISYLGYQRLWGTNDYERPFKQDTDKTWNSGLGYAMIENNKYWWNKTTSGYTGYLIDESEWNQLNGARRAYKISIFNTQHSLDEYSNKVTIVPESGWMRIGGSPTFLPNLYQMTAARLKGTKVKQGEQLRDMWFSDNLDYWEKPYDFRKLPNDNEFMIGWNIHDTEKHEKPIGAIYIPVGEGKTTLAKKHPNIFVDHDDLLDQREHARLQGKPMALSQFQKNVNVPAGKILLTWGPSTTPKHIPALGSVTLQSAPTGLPEDRSRFNQSNRLSVRLLQNVPLNIALDRNEHERICLDIAHKYMPGLEVHEYTASDKRNIAAMAEHTFTERSYDGYPQYDNPLDKYVYLPYIAVDGDNVTPNESIVEDDIPIQILNFWDDYDQTGLVRIIAPSTPNKLKKPKTFEQPNKIIKTQKLTLTKYPMRSRPVNTKMVYGELNASFIRMEDHKVYRKHNLNVREEVERTCDAYFTSNWRELSKSFPTITLNDEATREWLRGRTGVKKIDKELDELEAGGFLENGVNSFNVHQKLESLLKSNPIIDWAKQQVRIIVWQMRGIAAMFSPVFMAAKTHLKSLFGDRFVYADGCRPDELSARVRLVSSENVYFFEDDLAKQDKQTDRQVLDCHYYMYQNVLRVHPMVIQIWSTGTIKWDYKGIFVRGMSDEKVQSGTATTGIGNVITNMMCHRRMVERAGKHLKLMMVLGDDNMAIFEGYRPNDRELRVEIRDFFNMESSAETTQTHCVFLQMIIGKGNNGTCALGPDVIRLRNRFEVTNGVSADPESTINARCMSYLMLLGLNETTLQIIKDKNYPIEPVNWHDMTASITTASHRYKKSEEWVRNELTMLYNYLRKPESIMKEWEHFKCV
ncbi:polyprotein [Ceratobasidium endornavirus B]|uniref:polyprotein n=1 Tax=Ceratobasidium endornavirus B TaxID=1908807 RepID=UPI000870E386|nr:polyprotein [Ceratobasidium endornavirus B]AOV81679.1 polyprotein [Ceratobasidium endornavirus B]